MGYTGQVTFKFDLISFCYILFDGKVIDKNPSEQGRDPIPKMIQPTHSRRLRPTKKKREGRQVVSHWLFLSVTPFAYRMFDVF